MQSFNFQDFQQSDTCIYSIAYEPATELPQNYKQRNCARDHPKVNTSQLIESFYQTAGRPTFHAFNHKLKDIERPRFIH